MYTFCTQLSQICGQFGRKWSGHSEKREEKAPSKDKLIKSQLWAPPADGSFDYYYYYYEVEVELYTAMEVRPHYS